MVAIPKRRAYVARCASSRLSGLAREDGVDVKQVFHEAFEERRDSAQSGRSGADGSHRTNL
jgi:hypothetical protein